jgi:hypothetical protein
VFDAKLKELADKAKALEKLPVPIKPFKVEPSFLGTRIRDGYAATGQQIQRPVMERRVKKMTPAFDVIVARGDLIHLLHEPNGAGTPRFLLGDGQVRCEIVRRRGTPVVFNAKIYMPDDLKAAGLSKREWVRIVSSDGTWNLPELLAVTESPWHDALSATGLHRIVQWTPAGDEPFAPNIVKAAIFAEAALARQTFPGAGRGKTVRPEEVLAFWENTPLKDATRYCEIVNYWRGVVRTAAPKPKPSKKALYHHRMLTFLYMAWELNQPAKAATFASLGRWFEDRPELLLPFYTALQGHPDVPSVYQKVLLRGINLGRPDRTRITIFGLDGREN